MDQSHYQQIAKEFMDLWQKQVSAAVSDKQFIHTMLEMLQSMQAPNYGQTSAGQSRPNAASHTAHASNAGNELLAEFAYRLSMCEKRIAALEYNANQKPQKAKVKKTSAAKPSPKSSAGRTKPGSDRRSKKPRK